MQNSEFENAKKLYPSDSGTKSSRYGKDDQEFVEITLDIHRDEYISVSGCKSPDQNCEDPGKSLLGQSGSAGKSKSKSSVNCIASSSSIAGQRPRPGVTKLSRSKSRAEMALKGLRFITTIDDAADCWRKVENNFYKLTNRSNGLLHRSQFGECIGMDSKNPKKPKEFSLALFDALGREENVSGDSINKEQLVNFWEHITAQDFHSRLRTFFAMVDKDEDGKINKAEVREIITLSASANALDNIQEKADEYAALIMEALDPYHYGYIMIENLEVLLLQAPLEATRDVESKALSSMLSQKLKVPQSMNLGMRFYKGIKYFVLDNWKRIWVMALWICVMIGLFTWKFVEYQKRSAYQVMGVCVCLAKGAAETLKLNMAMILLPVCKNTITLIRTRTKLSAIVPFDDSLNFHQVIAIAISIGVGIHAITHLACDFPRLIAADEETYKPMVQYFGVQAKSYGHFMKSVEVLTGTGMVILMTIAFTLATTWFRKNKLTTWIEQDKLTTLIGQNKLTTWIRKSKRTKWIRQNKLTTWIGQNKPLLKIMKKITGFNAFWYSHHLFVIVYSLLLVHGYYLYLIKTWYKKTTWMYLMVPVLIYLSERLIRALRSSIETVSVLEFDALPEDALMLRMSRPKNFRYQSGQYMYLKCSELSSIEW